MRALSCHLPHLDISPNRLQLRERSTPQRQNSHIARPPSSERQPAALKRSSSARKPAKPPQARVWRPGGAPKKKEAEVTWMPEP